MAKLMSKSELIQKIADQHPDGLTRKDIKGVIEFISLSDAAPRFDNQKSLLRSP